MTYAHIFRAGKSVRLVITRTPALTSDSVIAEVACLSVKAAKDEARAQGAKPWNY